MHKKDLPFFILHSHHEKYSQLLPLARSSLIFRTTLWKSSLNLHSQRLRRRSHSLQRNGEHNKWVQIGKINLHQRYGAYQLSQTYWQIFKVQNSTWKPDFLHCLRQTLWTLLCLCYILGYSLQIYAVRCLRKNAHLLSSWKIVRNQCRGRETLQESKIGIQVMPNGTWWNCLGKSQYDCKIKVFEMWNHSLLDGSFLVLGHCHTRYFCWSLSFSFCRRVWSSDIQRYCQQQRSFEGQKLLYWAQHHKLLKISWMRPILRWFRLIHHSVR